MVNSRTSDETDFGMHQILNLSEEEFQTISELHKEEGKLLSLCDYGEGGKEPGYVIGWSLEAMGWEKLD